MNKTTFKIIEQLKENPFYIKLKEEDISLKIETFTLKNGEPSTAAEKKIFKKEIQIIKTECNAQWDKKIETFVKNEIQAMHSIYLHRCLTYKQLYKMYFLKHFDNVQRFELSIINNWIKLGIVKKIYFKHNNYVLFLTTRGVDILVNEYNFSANIMDDKKKVIKRGYFRANELEMHPRLINHQVHLNQFVLDFKRISKNIDKQHNSDIFSKIEYFDEKHISKYNSIRPDGLITAFNTDFFLEMDMSTESKKQLTEKWDNYRSFLSNRESSSTLGEYNKIIVLFIIENSKDLNYRISLVKDTFSQVLIDKLDSNTFDIYIGSRQQVLNAAFNNLLSSLEHKHSSKNKLLGAFAKEDFLVTYGYNVKKYFENIEYDYYIRKVNKDGSIKMCENTAIEFLINDYRDNPLSVLNKITYHKKNSMMYKTSLNREVALITIVNSEDEIFEDLKLINFDFDRSDNVYFINNNNLNTNLLSGLYQIDSSGNIFKFKNYSPNSKYHSHNIYTKKL